jgi:hypothetical protein
MRRLFAHQHTHTVSRSPPPLPTSPTTSDPDERRSQARLNGSNHEEERGQCQPHEAPASTSASTSTLPRGQNIYPCPSVLYHCFSNLSLCASLSLPLHCSCVALNLIQCTLYAPSTTPLARSGFRLGFGGSFRVSGCAVFRAPPLPLPGLHSHILRTSATAHCHTSVPLPTVTLQPCSLQTSATAHCHTSTMLTSQPISPETSYCQTSLARPFATHPSVGAPHGDTR